MSQAPKPILKRAAKPVDGKARPKPHDTPAYRPADEALVEREIDSTTVFEGRLMTVKRDRVLTPDGLETTREYTTHPGAALIIPLYEDGQVLVERQFRYPPNQAFIEFPAGKLDPGEDPLDSAKRELREETGLSAEQWNYLGAVHPVISYSTEVIYIFLARGLTAGQASLDPGECLELETLPFAGLLDGVRRGEVTDSKTLAAILWLDQLLRGQWSIDPPIAENLRVKALSPGR